MSNPTIKNLYDYCSYISELISFKEIKDDFPVSIVSNDSRKIVHNSIFAAIKGAGFDGHSFIPSAIKSGARAIVCENVPAHRVPGISYIRVNNTYRAYAVLCEFFFDKPSEKLELIGITGTKGKTTTAYLLQAILNEYVGRTGLISTVCSFDGHRRINAERTTPEAYELQSKLFAMKENGCRGAVIEVSSHALEQNRIANTKFAGAIFTNLSGEHLDYHKDMDNYFKAKKLLFQKHLTPNTAIAVNTDDFYGKKLADELKFIKFAGFGRNANAECRIVSCALFAEKTIINLNYKGREINIETPLTGEYNAYNVTGVATLALGLGISPVAITTALSKKVDIPGRLQKISTPNGATVFVDYAHTDDSLEKVLITLKPITKGKLICVFGCGGNRDRSKRPRMGAVSAKFADITILTTDNPRFEEPEEIIREICAGISEKANLLIEPDRRSAIVKSICMAGEGDIILLAGKGHETYQEVKGIKSHFDDVEEVLNTIKTHHNARQ